MADSAAQIIDLNAYRASRAAARARAPAQAPAAPWQPVMAMPVAMFCFWPPVVWVPAGLFAPAQGREVP